MKTTVFRAIFVAVILSSSFVTVSAQTRPVPAHATPAEKALSAEQEAALRKRAVTAFAAVQQASDACPIRADQPMVEWRQCLAGAVTTAETNYKNYVRVIRTLLLTPSPQEEGDSGMQRWFADNQRDFDAAARAWLAYYAAQCKSEASTVEPGSGMAETQSNCQLALLKERTQRISDVYGPMVGVNPK